MLPAVPHVFSADVGVPQKQSAASSAGVRLPRRRGGVPWLAISLADGSWSSPPKRGCSAALPGHHA
ncbi:predicted protein [Streptomyces viridosporus ATCC 14672]|uniref:Predicted protein n=1 Tax=Streptomyces viridosporus (strain ATCC 14672 / DSM 40746 / JCM 4963 / KCTC 9882 / NRRL B-12104 / FH 1290) TaxID=566461 RepID=D5ZNR6_STRV1|nr:predicted protein [Streptomyces viridosporus ATCC 14672]